MSRCAGVSALALLFLVSSVQADWTGGVEGGTVVSDGGSSTRLRLKLENNIRPLSHYVYADWLRGEDGENSYEAGYRPRYWFSDQLYGFAEASAKVERSLNIDNQRLLLGGLGFRPFSSAEQTLWFEGGLGSRSTRLSDDSELDDTFAVLRASFAQILSDLIRFELDFNLVDGESLTQTTAEAGVSLRIPGGAIKYSYRTRRVEPDGSESVEDSDSFVSFTYGF